MIRLAAHAVIAGIAAATLCGPCRAQTSGTATSTASSSTGTTTGSTGCSTISQAAVNGLNSRVQADDSNINAPKSVTSMTCLNNFFNGSGLNLITNLLDPANLLQAVEGQICNLAASTWKSLLGQVQCGLTITGFNLGFGGLGGGLSCPKVSFGGGGPPIGTIGIGNGSGGLYINGTGTAPTGYALPTTAQGSF
jgi:hypothetical protein